ncbi:Zn II 2Cys6 cluster transcripitional activator [Pyrenophora tritici-repentis]|uniref:Fungal specific transcription factor domain containing protein n=2 Tax=Pyrenophora tritici-repentis TaxID=45151 RepID=A0A2W1FUI4_9PLEO|nr:Zn(II)2Cys6 cluster transcripitional activator [Pyrenophora tritici-repentis Pt-1C-BFP]KAF7451749.1 Zn2Cys6 cluster transcripitional activator [Pyrenophora tritici-repentis]EDU45668.1 Zn(II)2Cys6 cluster transcripitional activator [Pyrenophora tritici-repentis Pt-1C-BFP]KAI0574373.1 Zn(II)2Cys6 cluster transcripitional activator [Pyrenophora tritici-repentis]KAI0575619.1 Zn(II)2Cys6 cluster transcripitional activator [Pyrenophora tritici-repentis]KAI0606563.1 Zn(II)2Cys6 cluster transcripit
MVLETPLLRVSRPVAACSRCRAAKVKCDGKLPACTACEKSNRASECSSTNDQFARGKERSYVATLESRVERLEKKIQEARARRKSSGVNMLDMSENSTPRRASVDTLKPSRPISKRAARRKEASEIDDLVSDFGLLAVNATARDFYGFTTEMSYARLIRSASTKEPLPTGLVKALPPKYAATPLIQHYLNNIFTLWPVFEEATLYSSVDAIYQQGDTATPWDRWSVRMVLAIACLSQSDSRGDTHYSDAVGHMNAALENAEHVLHPGYVSSIQALILWAIYATMDPHHFDSWTLVGAASRAMVDLGIHQDPSKNVAVPRAKLEIRRRVYWCLYSLDRSTSLVQTRAFSFSDEAANVAFPFNSGPVTSPNYSSPQQVFQQSFDTAVDLFKIREIQSEWYMDLFQSGREPWQEPYQYIWKQYARMSEWFQDMPQSTLPSVRAFFELELLYSYVYILSPSPRIPHIHEYAQRLIFEHCIAYAANLLEILEKPSNTVKPPVTFYDAMRAYMTGRQFVDVLSRNMDLILDPRPPIPPTPLTAAVESEDPLAPPTQISPPPFPSPPIEDGQMLPLDPTRRAINALNDYTTVLSKFGLRFGFTHWRDRFQRESSSLSAQLHQRCQISPHTSPPPQQGPNSTYSSPQWVLQMPPPAISPQAPHLMYQPTTPPSLFQPQSSPFAASMSYDTSPGRQTTNWATPSPQPQPLPELPQPSGGQTRRALVYGPGLPSARGHSPAGSMVDGGGWGDQQQQQGQSQGQDANGNGNGYFQMPSLQHQHSDGGGWGNQGGGGTGQNGWG